MRQTLRERRRHGTPREPASVYELFQNRPRQAVLVRRACHERLEASARPELRLHRSPIWSRKFGATSGSFYRVGPFVACYNINNQRNAPRRWRKQGRE